MKQQLTTIRNGSLITDPLIEEYTYDPNGDRIKSYNNITNTTTYTPFRELMVIVNSSGQYNYTYIYDGDNILVARINPDNSKWFYHSDHLGSTTLITNQSGDIVEETFYLPYGGVDSGGTLEVKLYEGKELDSGTGQYYYGARYYDPEKRLFIQPDSIIPNIYDPQQLNIYAFERGNPYGYVDESGEQIVNIAIAFATRFAPKIVELVLKSIPGQAAKDLFKNFGSIKEVISDILGTNNNLEGEFDKIKSDELDNQIIYPQTPLITPLGRSSFPPDTSLIDNQVGDASGVSGALPPRPTIYYTPESGCGVIYSC